MDGRFADSPDVPSRRSTLVALMRRILLLLLGVALLVLPAASAAGAAGRSQSGFLVVKRAAGDGGFNGPPVVTVVVHGFVVGRVTQEARVDVYHLQTAAGGGTPQAKGPDVTQSPVRWRSFTGREYSGSGFRFSAIGGFYRVVVRGAGVYLFAGGHGSVWLRGSSVYRNADGFYSLGGRPFRSLPAQTVKRSIGGG
jgi:hypothetical protein